MTLLHAMRRAANRVLKPARTALAALLVFPVRSDPRRIALLWRTRSGSNAIALMRGAERALAAGLVVDFIKDGGGAFLAGLRRKRRMARCGIVVSTHGPRVLKSAQRAVELWHGFPLKALGLMDEGLGVRDKACLPSRWKSVALIPSYSSLYSMAMNACYAAESGRYRITGAPRNDLLFRPDARRLILESLGRPETGSRIVFHMPTARDDRGAPEGGNKDDRFGFPRFDAGRFDAFLERNDLIFVSKLHPNTAAQLRRGGGDKPGAHGSGDRMMAFDDSFLEARDLDLYDLLGGMDLLVTDYSSVYFDLLLRDIPAVFTPMDLAAYRAGRSLLFEPYEFWTPGPKALDQYALEREILRSLGDREYYRSERETILSLVHAHRDAGSAARVWEAIIELAGGERPSVQGIA